MGPVAVVAAGEQDAVRVAVQDLTAPDVQSAVAQACDGLEVGTLIYNAGAAGLSRAACKTSITTGPTRR